jgi:hypothetical protein
LLYSPAQNPLIGEKNVHKAQLPEWEPSKGSHSLPRWSAASKARRLPTRGVHLFGLAVVSLLAREAVAQQAPGSSVALVDAFKFPGKATQAHHTRLRAGIEEALAREGWSVASATTIADCGTTNECLAGVAGEHGVGYVLRISGQRSRESEYGYDVSLDLYSVVTRHVRGGNWSCDICDSKRISEIAGKAAVDLLARTAKEEGEIKEAAKRAALAPVSAPIATATPRRADLVTPPRSTAEPSHISWIPWTMIGVGALGMVYGGWALYENGKSSGSYYPPSSSTYAHDVYSSNARGLGSLIGGGALAAVGLIWLALTPSHSAAVSASPNHVALDLRF